MLQYFMKRKNGEIIVKYYDVDSTMIIIEKVDDLLKIITNIFDQKNDVKFNSNIQVNHNYSRLFLNNIFPEVLSKLITSYLQYDYKLACIVKNYNHISKKGFTLELNIEHFATFSIVGHINQDISFIFRNIPFVNASLIELLNAQYNNSLQYAVVRLYSFFSYYLKHNYSTRMIDYHTPSITCYKNDKYITTTKCIVDEKQVTVTISTEVLDNDNLLLLILIIDELLQIISHIYNPKKN